MLLIASMLLLFLTISYLRVPGCTDHVDASTLCVTWLFAQGHAIYHAADAPQCFANLYGPSLYLYFGAALKAFGAGFFPAKVAAALATFAAIGISADSLRRVAGRWWVVGTLYLLLAILWYRDVLLWLRPEPLLLVAGAVGLWAAVRPRALVGAMLFGLAIGFTTNIKIHSAIFFLPMWFIAPYRFRPSAWVTAAVCCLATVALPWLMFQQLSIPHFFYWLHLIAAHPLMPILIVFNSQALLYLLCPPVVLFLLLRSRIGPEAAANWTRTNRPFLLAMGATMLLNLWPASKSGGGVPHFIPLLVPLSYAVALLVRALADAPAVAHQPAGERFRTAMPAALLTAFAAVAMLVCCIRIVINVGHIRSWHGGEIVEDLRTIAKTHPDRNIYMGIGGNEDYQLTWYRAYLLYAGQPYLMDPSTVAEMTLSHVPLPQATQNVVNNGTNDLWLIPHGGSPFTFVDFYGDRLFDDAFRESFLAHHSVREQTRYFDVWYNNKSADRQPVVLRTSVENGL